MEAWDALQQYRLQSQNTPQTRIRRYLLDKTNPLESFQDEEFRTRYRLTKSAVVDLMTICERDLAKPNNRGLPIPPLLKLTATLRFYAAGCFQIVAGDLEGLSQPSVSALVKEVSEIIAAKKSLFIQFSQTDQVLAKEIQGFYAIGQFPGVVGAIDCTHVRIQSPGGDDAELFRNRKGFFSINVQAICNSKLEFINIVARWRGSVHDARIFENSAIGINFENGTQKGILLGNNGYPCKKYLLTPLANPSSRSEQLYNRAHIKTRTTIERTFNIWKRIFPCLSMGLRIKTSTCLTVIVATAVLYNFARKHR